MQIWATKNEWLSQYKGSGAIFEDKWSNVIAGANIGLNTYLMRHEYNARLHWCKES